jgi:hypothetical protein
MRWRSGLLTASSSLLLAGCGGGGHEPPPAPPPPRIPSAVAVRLAAEADRVAAMTPGTCAARDAANKLLGDVIASAGSIPARYQEPLTSATNDLAARLAQCTEPKPAKQPPHDHGEHKRKGHRKHDEDAG